MSSKSFGKIQVNIADDYNMHINSEAKRNPAPYQTKKLNSGQSINNINKIKPIWQSHKSFKELRDLKKKDSKSNMVPGDINNKNSSNNISLDKNVRKTIYKLII